MEKRIIEILEKRNTNETEKLIQLARKDDYNVCAYGCGKIGANFGKDILNYLGVNIDYYCDNNNNLQGKAVVDNIMCYSPQKLFEESMHTICFLLIGYADIEEACETLVKNGVEKIVTYDDLLELSIVRDKYIPFLKKDRVAIYTCITGGYDFVRKHEYVSDVCDYYLISDEKQDVEDGVKLININEIVPSTCDNPIFQNRYCKFFPNKIFPDYRFSIYIDGNITITGPLEKEVHKLRKAKMATAAGNFTDMYYSYALRCAKMGADYENVILKQIKRYHDCGMPEDVGSYLCNVLIREHNNPVVAKMMDEWWNEFNNGAIRDQISLPFVFWKNGFTRDDVLQIANENGYGHYYSNPLWKYERDHKKKRFVVKEE